MPRKRDRSLAFGISSRNVQREMNGYEIKARTDPVTGQQSAFPGLEEGDDRHEEGHVFLGPAGDGMEYIRMVRIEAASVPSLLTAEKQPEKENRSENGINKQQNHDQIRDMDVENFWSGEAVIAAPYAREEYEEYDDGEQDPQNAYYRALIAHFKSLQRNLSSRSHQVVDSCDNDETSKKLTDPLPTTTLTASYESWYNVFSYTVPPLSFISGISQSSVCLALERMEVMLTKRNLQTPEKRRNISIWAWSLLAKCREIGQLSGEEVGVLRTLAKTALRLERKLRTQRPQPPESSVSRHFIAGSSDKIVEATAKNAVTSSPENGETRDDDSSRVEEGRLFSDSDEQLEQARRRLFGVVESSDLQQAGSVEAVEQDERTNVEPQPIMMMLDLIVTVVGEVFGQRDLLEQRSAW